MKTIALIALLDLLRSSRSWSFDIKEKIKYYKFGIVWILSLVAHTSFYPNKTETNQEPASTELLFQKECHIITGGKEKKERSHFYTISAFPFKPFLLKKNIFNFQYFRDVSSLTPPPCQVLGLVQKHQQVMVDNIVDADLTLALKSV